MIVRMEYLILFVLGLVFGSFGSVLVSRLQGEVSWQTWLGIFKGRSRCPYCWHTLAAKDLIPLISFLTAKGKCRYCGKSIWWFYPALEIVSGLVFVISWRWVNVHFGGDIASLIFWIGANRLLFLILVGDIISYHLNPRLWIGLVLWIIGWWFVGMVDWSYSIVRGLVFLMLFTILRLGARLYVQLRYKLKDMEWIWSWDIFVAFTIGLLMGWIFPPNEDLIIFVPLIYLIFAAGVSLIYTFVVAALQNFKMGKSIPFLPGMIIAFWVLMLWWDKIISWLVF